MIDALEARRAAVQAELVGHPEWPQRAITVEDGKLGLPFSAGDSQDYLDWQAELGYRYDGMVRRIYVQDTPGAPSLAELRDIQSEVSAQLKALPSQTASWSLSVDLAKGWVRLQHDPTSDPAFLNLLTRASNRYGPRFHASDSGGPHIGPETMPIRRGWPHEVRRFKPQPQTEGLRRRDSSRRNHVPVHRI